MIDWGRVSESEEVGESRMEHVVEEDDTWEKIEEMEERMLEVVEWCFDDMFGSVVKVANWM